MKKKISSLMYWAGKHKMHTVKMFPVKLWLSLLVSIAISPMTYANNYTANIQGKVTSVRVYPNVQILFQISNMPTVSGCNNVYFAFNTPAWSADGIKMMLTRLLSAYATGETINVGYDGVTCSPVGNYIDVEELGL